MMMMKIASCQESWSGTCCFLAHIIWSLNFLPVMADCPHTIGVEFGTRIIEVGIKNNTKPEAEVQAIWPPIILHSFIVLLLRCQDRRLSFRSGTLLARKGEPLLHPAQFNSTTHVAQINCGWSKLNTILQFPKVTAIFKVPSCDKVLLQRCRRGSPCLWCHKKVSKHFSHKL